MFNLVLEKAEEPEIKLPTFTGSSKKQESSRKTSISALLTTPKPLTVWITKDWKILKEMGILNHLTCFLRNLFAGQEATGRTGYDTTDWFQIGKGVHQGYILPPCLFNLYAEHIRRRQWQATPVLLPGKFPWTAVHGVDKSWTQLSDFTFTFHFYALEKETATHSSVLA